MLADTLFNLPEASEKAYQLNGWGVAIFFLVSALAVAYVIHRLPRPGDEDAYGVHTDDDEAN